MFKYIIIYPLISFFLTFIFNNTDVHSQQLYSYKSDSGSLTFTSRKPSTKNFSIVNPKSPRFSIFIHRGLGYNWTSKPKPSTYDSSILELAKKHNVEPAIVKAVIHVESAFNSRAVSSAGARGLMQLIPATAKRFGVSDSFHPVENMTGGIKYLSWLFERFDGNLKFVLAGYNAGEGAVDQYGGIPPYRETQDYVSRVMKMTQLYRSNFSGEDSSSTSTSNNSKASNNSKTYAKNEIDSKKTSSSKSSITKSTFSNTSNGGTFSRYRSRFKS